MNIAPDHVTDLHNAIKNINIELVKKILNNGIDVNLQNAKGDSSLHIAVKRYSICMNPELYEINHMIIDILLKHGANLNLQNKKGITPLHDAMLNGHNPRSAIMIDNILKYECDFNIKDNNKGETPFHYAASLNLEIVKKAIKHNGNPNIQDHIGNTPLNIAIEFRLIDIVEFLLNYEYIDINIKTKQGYNLINYASYDSTIEIIDLLIKKGIDINDQDKDGNTSLHSVSLYWRLDIIELLLKHGANPNIKNNDGETCLHSIMNSRIKYDKMRITLGLFLNSGVDPNIQDKNGNTILHLYASKRYLYKKDNNDMLELLFRLGVDSEIKNKKGKTASDCLKIKK